MTLYSVIREMLGRGQLTTRPSYHAQMGAGETLLYNGEPVRIFTEVTSLSGLVPSDKVLHFDRLTDVMLDNSFNVITQAQS